MSAAIVERADHTIGVTGDDERAQAELGGDEIVDIGNVTFMGEIDPGTAEYVRHLGVKDSRVGINEPVNAVLLREVIPVIPRRIRETGKVMLAVKRVHGGYPSRLGSRNGPPLAQTGLRRSRNIHSAPRRWDVLGSGQFRAL